MRPWFQLREAWGGWRQATPHIVDWPQAGQTAGKALCGADVDRPVFYPLYTAAAYRVKPCARCYELLERHRRDHIQPVQQRRSSPMTHELHPNAEADPGPEHDRTLPNAAEVPVWRDPDDATAVADEQAVITLTDDEQDGDD